MRRRVILLAVVVALAGACGGSDTGQPGDDAVDTTVASELDDAPEDDGQVTDTSVLAEEDAGEDDGGSDSSLAANVAVVTIGDQTFEFDVTPGAIQRCDPGFFGAFWVLGGGLDMLIVDEDNANHDPPYVKVSDPDNPDVEWWANSAINESLFQAEVPAGQSQVDSFTVDGNTVTGTATFIEKSALTADGEIPDSVQGSFEVTCEEE